MKSLYLHVTWEEFNLIVSPNGALSVEECHNKMMANLRAFLDLTEDDLTRIDREHRSGCVRIFPHREYVGPRLTIEEEPDYPKGMGSR